MKWVVVREDWAIIITNTSRRNAEALLRKYMKMRVKTRSKWLEQWGVVMHFPYYFTFDKSLIGVYTVDEFLSKYRRFFNEFVTKASEEIARAKNKHEAAVWKRRITLFRKWLQWLESYMPIAKIERKRIERQKRNEPVAKLVDVMYRYGRYLLRNYAKYALNYGRVGIAEFKETIWLFMVRDEFIRVLVVRKDASDEDITNAVQAIIEDWKDEIEGVQFFIKGVGNFNCEEVASNKGELTWCREVYGKVGTVLTMLKLLVAGGGE